MHIVGRMFCITVLRFVWSWPATEREKARDATSLDVLAWIQKAKHKDNEISRQHAQIIADIFCPWGVRAEDGIFEDALVRLRSGPHKQTEGTFVTLFFTVKLFSPKKKFGRAQCRSDRVSALWVCSLSGLACISAALLKTPSDHHPKSRQTVCWL